MCDKVWKDYRERGVYNQGWIDPAGDMFGGGRRRWRQEVGGFAEPAALKRGPGFPCHSVRLLPASHSFVVVSCFMRS